MQFMAESVHPSSRWSSFIKCDTINTINCSIESLLNGYRVKRKLISKQFHNRQNIEKRKKKDSIFFATLNKKRTKRIARTQSFCRRMHLSVFGFFISWLAWGRPRRTDGRLRIDAEINYTWVSERFCTQPTR